MKPNNPKHNWLKLPNYLDLGTFLPGQYGQSYLVFNTSNALFLNLNLTSKAIQNGFFLLQEGGNQCFQQINVIVKPNKQKKIMVGSYPQQISESKAFYGELLVSENQKIHTIKMGYHVQIPRIKCLKMLKDTTNNLTMLKCIVNKAVTSDVRIALFNQQQYSLNFQVGLLNKASISDKSNPYILKSHTGSIKAEPKQQFMIFLTLQTNIGFAQDPKGLKKVVFRNVLTLKTNSAILWCLPVEITVVFVKQPQIKQQ